MPATTAPASKYTRANRPGRIINYSDLNKAYVDRGRIETWVDVALFQGPQRVDGRNGRPLEYSDGLIEMLLLLKVRFNLPYRALEGLSCSLFQCLRPGRDKAVPSFGTIAHRVRGLGRSTEALVTSLKGLARAGDDGRPKAILVDSTGVSITGMGPWRATRPWTDDTERKKRQFVKLHIALNPRTGMIEMAIVSRSNDHDSSFLTPLLDEAGPERVSMVAADGAYDSRRIYKYLLSNGIRDIRIPPPENAVFWDAAVVGADVRNEAVSQVDHYGRKEYKKRTGYHVRSLVESAMLQLNRLTGSRAKNRSPEGIQAEVLAACVVLNKQTSLGRATYNKRAWTATLAP